MFRTVFNELDHNGFGIIPLNAVQNALVKLDQAPTKTDMEQIFKQYGDADISDIGKANSNKLTTCLLTF